MDTTPTQPGPQDNDAQGLDRLIEAGWNATAVSGSDADRAKARSVATLLGLLDAGLDEVVRAHRDVRIESTVARVAAAATGATDAIGLVGVESGGPMLADADARALDAMIDAGWSTNDQSPAASLVALLDVQAPMAEASRTNLINRTLAKVEHELESERSRLRIRPSDERMAMPRRLRLSDLGAMAAMFLIGMGILWPVVTGMRAETQRITDASNMQAAGLGFGMFANDHADRVPYYAHRDPKGVWWRVGDPPRSHSANLFSLVRAGYATVAELASPGNASAPTKAWDDAAEDWRAWDEVSYSYQLFGAEVPRLSGANGAARLVLTDRSPVIEQARRGRTIDPLRGSPNTKGWGQHLLFSDGRVVFSRSPVLPNGDNIWLPRHLDDQAAKLTGTERPADASDAFVGP